MKRFVFICAAVIGLLPTMAAAGTISCPGTAATTDREFSLTTAVTSSCVKTGNGNINGNGDAINALGYVTIDKTDNSTAYVGADGELTSTPPNAALTGTFSFVPVAGYHRFVIAFKSGEGRFNPDWAAFLLPSSVTSGSWTISEAQDLSHVNLYAEACGGTTGVTCEVTTTQQDTDVPEPTSMALLGLGLLGAGFARGRRTKNQ